MREPNCRPAQRMTESSVGMSGPLVRARGTQCSIRGDPARLQATHVSGIMSCDSRTTDLNPARTAFMLVGTTQLGSMKSVANKTDGR